MGKGKNRWTDGQGWKVWAVTMPQPQEICYSKTSSMAELLEQSWKCWKEELTCGVDGLAEPALSLAAFPFPISLLASSDQQKVWSWEFQSEQGFRRKHKEQCSNHS